jgi:archaellum component FlaG (FlaF/FlaG flagellin family)
VDKVIVTVLLIIGGVVAAFAIMNGVLPAVERSSSAINTATDQVNDQIKSQIEIINVSSAGPNVHVWVKNTGTSTIGSIENSDVFITSGFNIERFSFGTDSTPAPYWGYQLSGDHNLWSPTVTNEIVIHMRAPLEPGSYQVKYIIPNGIGDQVTFGVN